LISDSLLERAAQTIREGGLVSFPTETVYGLGANALDAVAVAGIFEIKRRPRFDPLIVHIAAVDELSQLVVAIPQPARELIRQFWPGPLSLVLPKRPSVPDIVTAGLAQVAVRCPAHEVARALIEAAGVPIAAPSANRFGCVSPTTAEHVREQFGDELEIILDAGPCDIGVESTVISFAESQPMLLRPGGVTLEEIEGVVGPVAIGPTDDVHPASPGQLSRHYAPSTPLVISDQPLTLPPNQRYGLLTLQPADDSERFAAIEVLSASGSMREAASNLFAALRRLDAAKLHGIVARPVPEVGLGRAIMDRLRRAAAR
jgi:L-threonylcarbamoyladenylate synthase